MHGALPILTKRDDVLPYDLILVGGGLANGLIAWRLRTQRPELNILLLEAGDAIGGNHTWSFHDGDLTVEQRVWIAPLVGTRWPRYEVVFPGHARTLESGYASIASSDFARVISAALGPGAAHRRAGRGRHADDGAPGRRRDLAGRRGDRRPRPAGQHPPGARLPDLPRPGSETDRPTWPDGAGHHGRQRGAARRLPLRLPAALRPGPRC